MQSTVIPFTGRPWDNTTTLITINQQTHIILGTLTLRNPSFGNESKLKYNTIKKVSMDDNLIICGNSSFQFKPFIETLSYTIDYLSQLDGLHLIQLLQKSLGIIIGLTNYEGKAVNGLIVTPELTLTQKDRNNYSVSFDFEIVP